MSQGKPSIGTYYEFFAGGGMARAGLGPAWECLFANDNDVKKVNGYCRNWGCGELKPGDVRTLSSDDLPRRPNLVWASFPCQDLSLAGMGAGLEGDRSGSFWPFWKLMQALRREERQPDLIVLENVCGALTSHQGRDFESLIGAFAAEGYRYGALVMDASLFVPQSRPRLFIVAVKNNAELPSALAGESPDATWTTAALIKAHQGLSEDQCSDWVWWRMPKPLTRTASWAEILEGEPTDVRWHTGAETKRFMEMMSPVNRKKLRGAQEVGRQVIGTMYRRTRKEAGERVQRAEVRFDGMAGCLRTPAGGSSRQTVLVVDGEQVRSRLLSPREAARLMGLPEEYALPENYNDAYHLSGDGVVVPVVRYLAGSLLEPLLTAVRRHASQAA